MNLGKLIQECEYRTGWNDPNFRPQWRSFINEGVRTFALKHPWPGLEDLLTAVSDGTRFLILPHFVDSVISILNTTNRLPLDRAGDFDRESPSLQSEQTTGIPALYDKIGTVPTSRAPTGCLTMYSSSASDVSECVRVVGYVGNTAASGTALASTLINAEVWSNGTSKVTLPNLFTSFVSISKTTETLGDFWFEDAGDMNKLTSFIPRHDVDAAFKRIQLMYAPASETAFEIKYRRKVPPLVADQQSPHPSVDPDFVIQYAIGCYWRHREQYTKAQVQDQRALSALQDVAHKENNFDEPYERIVPQIDPLDRDPTLW